MASNTAIFNPSALSRMANTLADACPVMSVARCAPLRPWTRRSADFEGLARSIAYQQLAGAAASAIWGRVAAAVRPMTAKRFLSFAEDDLRALGLSRPKIRHIQAIAEAEASGALNFKTLGAMPLEEARETLTAIRGVGPWTADIFLMSAYGCVDIFPAGDLGLQLGYQRAAGLAERPSAKELDARASAWAPRRSVAAMVLWTYLDFERAKEKARA